MKSRNGIGVDCRPRRPIGQTLQKLFAASPLGADMKLLGALDIVLILVILPLTRC